MNVKVGAAINTVLMAVVGAQGAATFDVVSIKSNTSGSLQRNFNDAEGGHFAAVNVALGDLIRISHEVRPAGVAYSDLANAVVPWLYTEHFDVRATTSEQPTRAQLMAIIRAMLADRFHLRVHAVFGEETIFELRLDRENGTLGPGLKRSDVSCAGPSPPCSLTNLPGKIAATGIPLEGLAHMLSGAIEGHFDVRDRTGLTGQFAVDLTWTPSQANVQLPAGVAAPRSDPDGDPLPTALRDQLGLRLVRTKVDVPVLVVDGAEKPSPD
jgi:uncharacterized protein (TIGR03435 family)